MVMVHGAFFSIARILVLLTVLSFVLCTSATKSSSPTRQPTGVGGTWRPTTIHTPAYAGKCEHGKLVAPANRTGYDHCGSCDTGYRLTARHTCEGALSSCKIIAATAERMQAILN